MQLAVAVNLAAIFPSLCKWKAESKSRFCYSQTLWSGKECITLLRNKTDGGFIHVFEGQTRVLKEGAIEKGNKI